MKSILLHANIGNNDTRESPPPLPGSDDYDELPQFPKRGPLPFRRTIRRLEQRKIVPLVERRSTKWSALASFHAAST